MSRMAFAFVVLLAAYLPAAEASLASRCRNACAPAIANCVATTGQRRRACRRQYVRACKQRGFAACDLTPQTTTTTQPPLPPTTTTVPLHVTTTTATVVTSTTTTTSLPSVPNYSGNWRFLGVLAEDTCGVSSGLDETFTMSQVGSGLSCSVGSLPGVTLYGTVTPDGLELVGSFYDSGSGCEVVVALVALDDGTVVLTAGTGFEITCGLVSCQSIWVGTLSRY